MILIMGIPNAGKTTYSQRYSNVIHWDDLAGNRKSKVIDAILADPDVCVEGVYGKAEDRTALVQASNQKNICIWLDVPVDVCLQREHAYRKRPDQLVLWSAEGFQAPTYAEGWDEIIRIT